MASVTHVTHMAHTTPMPRPVERLPATTTGPRLAADIVAVVREGSGIRLDYSPDSLAVVDRMLGGIRRERPPREAVDPALRGFGAYAAEVLVRNAGATWVAFDEEQRDRFGQPFGVRTPDGRLWNPLGKAVRRYDNGPGDSLRVYYRDIAGSAGTRTS